MSALSSPGASGLPSYLSTPPTSRVSPPVQTRHQVLPFGELAWEDFERLCLRLARLEADVLHCQLYGTAGQNQDGIDLYARLSMADEFRVYQCKRENEFGPAKIREAVDRFLGGKWAKTAKTLVLCTKESLVSRQRADEVEKQRERMKKEGVGFITWDSEELSTKLKDHAELIDDFFDRVWVVAFLGQETADRLGSRFDATGITEYRLKLGALYRRVFARHDPGFPIGRTDEGESLDLSHRYVVPDVLVLRDITPGVTPSETEQVATATNEDAKWSSERQDPRSTKRSPLNESAQVRTPVEAWLKSAKNLLLIGSPGSGKSSLLRYLATDLLTNEPVLPAVAARWGSFLPVWVSFPLWAELVEHEGQEPCSLSVLLRRWLKSWDEERLWPLIERALSDDRLLLLVDGLDEWTNESAAQVALQRLEVFVAQRGVPSVAVSRPHGLIRLGTRPAGWITGTLAGFTREQQRELAFAWFRFRERVIGGTSTNGDEAERQAHLSTGAFLDELGRSPDLAHLAENPLLLTLLVFHRIHNVRLPQTRFKAYESLVEHLLATHPQRRRAAATVTQQPDELTESDLRCVLARLAFQIHSTSAPGVILIDEAMRCVEAFLRDEQDGLGLDLPNARRLARWVTDVGETNLGLLVRQSPSELGFLHRTFQEFLAGFHLSRLPLEAQKEEVLRKATLPQWREVILGLVHCSRRPADVDELIAVLRDLCQRAGIAERLTLESLLGEVAFGDFNSSPRVARQLANETFDLIETGTRMPHREVLLSHALGGLASSRTRESIRERLRLWFPCWLRWRGRIFEAMKEWPKEPETVRTLWVGMFDQEPSVKFEAARTLAKLGAGDNELGERIERLAFSCEDLLTRASAIDALTFGWPQKSGVEGVIDQADRAGHSALRFAAIRARAVLGKRVPSDRDTLLRLADRRANLDFTLRHDVAGLLVDGWSGDQVVKEACLQALSQRHMPGPGVDDEIAWQVLLAGFPGDDDVVNAVIRGLEESQAFSGMLGQGFGWHLLVKNFSTCTKLIGPVDQWIEKQEHALNDVGNAALLGKTAIGKRSLLGMLGQGRFSYSPALSLAKGWGLDDPEVACAFKKILDSPSSKAGECGHVIHLILRDPVASRKRLLELLQDPECKHPDLVLHSLREISQPTDKEIVDAVFKNGTERPDVFWMDRDNFVSILIEGFHRDQRVRDLAKESLTYENPPHVAIARGFGDDPELRSLLRRRLNPLPDQLRLNIAGHLADESPDTEFSRDLLSQYRREEDPSVKCEASLSYYRLLVRCNAVTDAHVDALGADIVCYGPDHKEQRQAAFCGLATIGRLDKMVSAQETIGDSRPCSISLHARSPRPSTALLRCILEHWDALRATFGEELLARLSKSPGKKDLFLFYNDLVPHADAYAAVQQEILHALEQGGERVLPLNIFQFVARVLPRSQFLLEACLRMLHIGDDGSDVRGPMAEIGASVLGEHFGGDDRPLQRILAGRGGEYPYHKTVVALAEGWPNHPFLEAAYRAMKDEPSVPRTDETWHRLACVSGTVEEALAVFRLFCRTSSLEFRHRNWSIRPVQQRLRKDDTFRDAIMSLLDSHPTPSERASAPRLLALARGVDASLRGWCERELVGQTRELPSPEIGHDIVSKAERCVVQSLLDVVIGGDLNGREVEPWFDE